MTSLRLKIALAMAALVLFSTSIVGVISYRSTSARLVAEVDRSITEATSLLVGTNEIGRQRVPSRGLLGVYSVRIVSQRGDAIASSFEVPLPLTDQAAAVIGNDRAIDRSTLTVDGDRYRVHTVGGAFGAVQIGRSLGETDRVLQDVRTRTVSFVLIVSLFAAIFGWMLASSVAAPLRRLTRAATDVERSGDLDVALPEPGRDEVGRLGTAFASMLGALHRSKGEQQRLVQDAGHELRTPLTSLRTNLAVLQRHPDMATEMRDRIITDLDGEVGELTDLVNELVAVASGDLADQPPQEIALGAAVTSVAERVSRRRGRTIETDVDGAGVVFAPLAGIERAITNLLDNAAKFDTTGGAIRIEAVGGRVSVFDSGPGIPPEDLALVFDRFHRSTAARSMPGSGLGLAIVREVVERHGGTVSASNRPEGGAAVGFELPVYGPPAGGAPTGLTAGDAPTGLATGDAPGGRRAGSPAFDE